QVDAATVVSVRRRRADAPERGGEEFRLYGAVVVALVKIRPEVVAFEIREDVSDHECAALGRLYGGHSGVVVSGVEQRHRRGEQAVEPALFGIERRLQVGDAA